MNQTESQIISEHFANLFDWWDQKSDSLAMMIHMIAEIVREKDSQVVIFSLHQHKDLSGFFVFCLFVFNWGTVVIQCGLCSSKKGLAASLL